MMRPTREINSDEQSNGDEPGPGQQTDGAEPGPGLQTNGADAGPGQQMNGAEPGPGPQGNRSSPPSRPLVGLIRVRNIDELTEPKRPRPVTTPDLPPEMQLIRLGQLELLQQCEQLQQQHQRQQQQLRQIQQHRQQQRQQLEQQRQQLEQQQQPQQPSDRPRSPAAPRPFCPNRNEPVATRPRIRGLRTLPQLTLLDPHPRTRGPVVGPVVRPRPLPDLLPARSWSPAAVANRPENADRDRDRDVTSLVGAVNAALERRRRSESRCNRCASELLHGQSMLHHLLTDCPSLPPPHKHSLD